MEVILLKKAREDKAYWKQTGNMQIMKRITTLLNDIQAHPFTGIGKPEQSQLSRCCSISIFSFISLLDKLNTLLSNSNNE